jgi:hypothetical protein
MQVKVRPTAEGAKNGFKDSKKVNFKFIKMIKVPPSGAGGTFMMISDEEADLPIFRRTWLSEPYQKLLSAEGL